MATGNFEDLHLFRMRLFTIVWTTLLGIAGPLGLIIATFMIGIDKHKILIERFGALVVGLTWLRVLPISLICFSIVYYLTRPKVKEQFK